MMTDPVADLLTRIRNANLRRARTVIMPASKLKVRIAEVLKEEGFVKNFRLIEDKKQGTLRVYLKYGTGGEKMISGLVRVSRPGRRTTRIYGRLRLRQPGLVHHVAHARAMGRLQRQRRR